MVIAVVQGVPQIALRHVFSDQHEGMILLTDAKEKDNVIVPQTPQQFNLSLKILYLLPRFLPQHLDRYWLTTESVGLEYLEAHAKALSAIETDATFTRPYKRVYCTTFDSAD